MQDSVYLKILTGMKEMAQMLNKQDAEVEIEHEIMKERSISACDDSSQSDYID